MNSIKAALHRELLSFEHKEHKEDLGRQLFEKVLEKKRRQDEKIKLLFQISVLSLLVLALFFAFSISHTIKISDYQIGLTAMSVLAILIFVDICQKMLGFMVWRK